jgi:hypothetical protein
LCLTPKPEHSSADTSSFTAADGLNSLSMKPVICAVLLFAILGTPLLSQAPPVYDMARLKAFQKQLVHDKIYIWISPETAAGLLVQKADPVLKVHAVDSHLMATVVVAFEIDKDGELQHATAMSGPKVLQKRVLDAVRKYKYKPCLSNGVPSAVASTVSVTVANY